MEIYRAENEDWILEVVDEHGNSTVWDDLFPTDQAALDEAMRTIDEQGIDAVIGPPSGHAPMPTMPIVRAAPKVGRNDPCPCGSGKKVKKCCGGMPTAPSTLH